jgi:hypothetical protein
MCKSICDAPLSIQRFVSQLQPDIPQIVLYSNLKLIFWNRTALSHPQLLLVYLMQEVSDYTAFYLCLTMKFYFVFHSVCLLWNAARWLSWFVLRSYFYPSPIVLFVSDNILSVLFLFSPFGCARLKVRQDWSMLCIGSHVTSAEEDADEDRNGTLQVKNLISVTAPDWLIHTPL